MGDRVFSARVLTGEPAALETLRAAVAAAGSIPKAAKQLGVSSRTLSRWLAANGITPTLAGKAAIGRTNVLARWRPQTKKKAR